MTKMEFARLFMLCVVLVCVSYAQRQGGAQPRPRGHYNQQYRYAARLRNTPSRLNQQRKQLGRGYNRAQFQGRNVYNRIADRSLGYGNYLRQIGRGYGQNRIQNPIYRSPVGYSSYKTGYPIPARFPGYSSNYAPLPVQAPGLYGFDNYQVDKWSEWSRWSGCSRSCDGGVQERTRNCKSSKLAMTLSLYKGQGNQRGNCPGFGKEFQPCNTSPCISVKSFEDQKFEARKAQCTKFDNQDYLGQRYTWMPYIRDGLNECSLYCMASGYRMFAQLADKVDDGTICGKHGHSACYNGTCSRKRPKVLPKPKTVQKTKVSKPVVDGGVVNPSRPKNPIGVAPKRNFLPAGRHPIQNYRSAAVDPRRRPGPQQQNRYPQYNKKIVPKINRKPILNPNRLVTRKVSGMYNSKSGLKLGYNEIFKIPVGAFNIRIQEARPSQNYLALKVGDDYLVNGRWSIVLKKEIKAAGTIIKYRLNRGPKSTEIVTAAGPIKKELKIVLLYQEGPPEVLFNYTIKLPASRGAQLQKSVSNLGSNSALRARTKPTLHWSVAGWTKCTQPCGGGEQQLSIKCVAVYPGRKTTVVKSSYCLSLKKPPQRKRMCNLRPCKPSWKLLPWQPCNKKCGYGGYQQREVRCMRVILTRQGKVEINSPFYTCGRRPAIRKECPYVPCYAWKSDPWSQCSRTCDKGTQSRRIFCTSDDKIRDDSHCEAQQKPEALRMCNLRPCRAAWFAGGWSKCSTICGEGKQTRLVFCAGKDGSSLPESYCKHQSRPSSSRVCIHQKCNGIWFSSNWTQCTTSCGTGERSRMVLCFGMQNGSMQQVSEFLCDYHTKPIAKERCNMGECQPEWYTTEWSQCSAACGRGIKTRQINCMMKDGKQGRGCQIETRPNAAMICQSKPCENGVDVQPVIQRSRSPSGGKQLTTLTVSKQIGKKRVSEDQGQREEVVQPKTEKSPRNFGKGIAQKPRNSFRIISKSKNKLTSERNNQKSVKNNQKSVKNNQKFVVHSRTSVDNHHQSVETTKKSVVQAQVSTRRAQNNLRPTTKAVVLTTRPKIIVQPKCKNTFKKAYCAVILKIGFCKFTTYKNRCCASCSGGR